MRSTQCELNPGGNAGGPIPEGMPAFSALPLEVAERVVCDGIIPCTKVWAEYRHRTRRGDVSRGRVVSELGPYVQASQPDATVRELAHLSKCSPHFLLHSRE